MLLALLAVLGFAVAVAAAVTPAQGGKAGKYSGGSPSQGRSSEHSCACPSAGLFASRWCLLGGDPDQRNLRFSMILATRSTVDSAVSLASALPITISQYARPEMWK